MTKTMLGRERTPSEELKNSKKKGAQAEVEAKMILQVSGAHRVERRPLGRDFDPVYKDLMTGKETRKHVEVKSSSTAPLSRLQKKMQKKD